MAGLRTGLKSLPEQYSSHRRSLVVPELRLESAADLPRVSPETTRNTLRTAPTLSHSSSHSATPSESAG
jgi:hypothetical protein